MDIKGLASDSGETAAVVKLSMGSEGTPKCTG